MSALLQASATVPDWERLTPGNRAVLDANHHLLQLRAASARFFTLLSRSFTER
jgi:hypothetical protein